MADAEPIERSPLRNAGTSQAERLLAGLTPDYVKLDERGYTQWVVFASELARLLRFYDVDGFDYLAWQRFFGENATATLGTLAVQNIDDWRIGARERIEYLRENAHAGNDAELRRNFSELVAGALTLAQSIDAYVLRLDANLPFRATLRNLIQTRLGPVTRRLIGYVKAAKARTLLVSVSGSNWRLLGTSLKAADVVMDQPQGLSSDFWQPPTAADMASIAPDDSVFGASSSGVFAPLFHAAHHVLFSGVFDRIGEVYARLITEAEQALLQSFESPAHQPHYALFLAFLKLFRTEQTKLNGLTQRHLDHYYRDVLRLRPRQALPDHVHLLATLNKGVAQVALPAGTRFKAGKLVSGEEVFYALDRETVCNRAEVAALMSMYRVDHRDSYALSSLGLSERVFASPVSTAADGLGTPFPPDVQGFHPFLNATRDNAGRIVSVDMPPAQLGFALASHYLLLREGDRKILLRVGGSSFADLPAAAVRCRLSGDKGLFDVVPTRIAAGTFSVGAGACTEIEIELASRDPAVIGWRNEVHGPGPFDGLPVAMLLLHHNDSAPFRYASLEQKHVERIEIAVEVGHTVIPHAGLRQLQLYNDAGAVDGSKPFMPWGAQPDADAAFTLGSEELFYKQHATFNVTLDWANHPGGSTGASARVQFLEGGTFNESSVSIAGGRTCSHPHEHVFATRIALPDEAVVDAHTGYPPLTAGTRGGYARIVLTSGFGHKQYPQKLLEHILDPAKHAAPALPYTPLVNSIQLDYDAASRPIELNATAPKPAVRMFHVGAFGYAELRGAPTTGAPHTLVPVMRAEQETSAHIGEWMIGLRELAPYQAVNLLVQVLDGSTDPLLSKPAKHVQWSYWAGTGWRLFREQDVSDGTAQLVRSGIVALKIPPDATTDAGVLPHGLIWVMAAVSDAVGAVCRVLSVQAQAMRATLAPVLTAAGAVVPEQWLAQPMAADTITRLANADARIKRIRQPYAAFGGRPAETDFALRVSERLRHKGRASTLWDIEHLVLDAFPQLYKVKCLNHTQIEDHPDQALAIYSEMQPGHVAVVTIPKVEPGELAQALKPLTHRDLLTAVRDFLAQRVTGQLAQRTTSGNQLRVHVCNPVFEEVQLELSLQLAQGFDDFSYYKARLQEELTQFMSPWAYRRAELSFGGRISKSVLVNFIEERPYVDFVTDVVMKHKTPGAAMSGDVEEISATTGRSVLVSARPEEHLIHAYVP